MGESKKSAGKLVIISGPSGVGKSTVVRQLIDECNLPLSFSVSATTRPKRPGEVHGKEYMFLTNEQFKQHVDQNDFLEYVEVFGHGHWYGTLRETVAAGLKEGQWIILEIDVEGAAMVTKHVPDAISIFIHPGSVEELERRLRGRATETEEAIQRRLEVGRRELDGAVLYKHIVTNKTVEQTVSDICELLVNSECGEKPECTTN